MHLIVSRCFCAFLLSLFSTLLWGQASVPTAAPTMTIVAADGSETEETAYSGGAPLNVRFDAHAEQVGTYEPRYEWQFLREGSTTPFLTRYDATTAYSFIESGTFTVRLLITFRRGVETVDYIQETPFSITISESKLEVPNAFTPNGDGVNDVFRVKEGYQSLVDFHAVVVNRWGRKIAEWRDPADGWDGRMAGTDAPDGAYYLRITAVGADGVRYNVKKTINLLRQFLENSGTTP